MERCRSPKHTFWPKRLDGLRAEDGVTVEIITSAEAHLVEIAPDFTPTQLRILARRVLEVVAPQIGEQAEARALEAEERAAAKHLTLTFLARPSGIEGVTEIRIRTTDQIATRLRTHLEALTAPRHQAAVGGAMRTEERRPYTRRLGEAFNTLIETLDPNRLPIHGGTATTIMITIGLADLQRDLAAASVTGSSEGEQRITASQTRRLACNAMIIPAVLGGKSEILDLGRARRLFTPTQRKAMALRDKTCRAHGCTMPATWREAHHFNNPGANKASPTSKTANYSAPSTTTEHTTTTTPPTKCPTATSDSPDDGEQAASQRVSSVPFAYDSAGPDCVNVVLGGPRGL